MDSLQTIFSEFLKWRLSSEERGRLRGDPISRLARDWDTWLVVLDNERSRRIIQQFTAASEDEPYQQSFLAWLNSLSVFAENGNLLACFQLVQCQGFSRWSVLRECAEPVLEADAAVHCLFLIDGHEGSPGVVKSMVASLGPEVNKGEPAGKILPINFGLSEHDGPTWRTLDEAMGCVRRVFGAWGVFFWIGYIVAGDFVVPALYRVLRILILLPRIRRALRRRNVYLRINTRTGAPVAGPSLGLAACVASILALARIPGDRNSKFLSRFLKRLFAALPSYALTGRLDGCKIEPVRGIQEKLSALQDAPQIQGALIPKDNLVDVETPALSLRSTFVPPVRPVAHKYLLGALWVLVPLRKTWLIVNAASIIGLMLFWHPIVMSAHAHIFAPMRLVEIETKAGRFGRAIWELGLPLRGSSSVSVRVLGHTGDGPTTLDVSTLRMDSASTDGQCLRVPGDTDGDWRSRVVVPVIEGVAKFDLIATAGPQGACRGLVLSLDHWGERQSEARIAIIDE